MRAIIQKKLITESTSKLTLISAIGSVVITMMLTGILSLIMLKRLSIELLAANSIIGIVVPLLIAPFALQLLKTATNWENVSRELHLENLERKNQERKASQKAQELQAISELAIESAAAPTDINIMKLIAEKLRDITDALGVGVTIYDPNTRTLSVKHIAVAGQVLSLANQLVGNNITSLVATVSPEMEKHMLTNTVESFSDLSEVTFGAVPKPAATAIKNTLGVGRFMGLALSYGDKLIGTAIIAQREGQLEMDPEVCKTLAHVAATAIQRKHAEDALRESELKFRTIIENLSEGILLVNEQGLVIECNPAQEVLCGLDRNEILGRPIWDIQFKLMPENSRTPEFHEELKRKVQNILKAGTSANFNHSIKGVIYLQSGETKHILQTSFPIRTDKGNRIGSIMRDISAQKQSEADREKLITELKSKNTELEQFTYTVSHDLKAPLITIRGFVGLLEKDTLAGNSERMKNDLTRIAEATDKMQRLLNELLELSRIGRIANPPQEVSFETIVQEALVIVRGRWDTRTMKIVIAEDLPVVFVDRARLVQVVQNLLDNAAKFIGTQTDPHIEIGCEGTDQHGKLIFFVKDNGIGIPPQQLENVFGLFKKLDVNADGTGIGLSLVKRIIEIHGGLIWITSEGIGCGTTVYFTLPTA